MKVKKTLEYNLMRFFGYFTKTYMFSYKIIDIND